MEPPSPAPNQADWRFARRWRSSMRIRFSGRSARQSRLVLQATTFATCEFCWLTRRGCSASTRLRGFALHLHSCPLLQQRERCSVVEIAMSLFCCQVVDLLHGFESRQLNARFLRGFEREQDVLVHKAQGEIRGEVALQDEGRFVLYDSGAHHRGLDQGNQLPRLHAEFCCEGEGLSKAFEDESDLQIHGQLGGLSLAGFTHPENLFAHGREQRIEALDGRSVASDHEDQRSISRADFRS